MKKANIIVPALLTIAACGGIIAGSTYALFTSEARTNITVSSGKVEITSVIEDLTLSHKEADATGTYQDVAGSLYSGTATLDDATQTITIDKMVPMDKISFNIKVSNASNVKSKYRTVVEAVSNTGLYSGLTITIGGEEFSGTKAKTNYESLDPGSDDIIIPVTIELPEEAGNEYQGKSCTLAYKVEAIQGNVFDGIYEVDPTTAQETLDSIKGDATVILKEGDYSKLYLRQDLDTSTRRSDLDKSTSYIAYYRQIKDLTIKAAEGATVTCDGIELESGLFFHSSAPASNQAEMNRANSGFISYLDVEDLSIEGITFDNETSTAVCVGDNETENQIYGSALLVDNLVVKNCTGTGDSSATNAHFFEAGTGSNSLEFLDTGKKPINNVYLINNTINGYYQPICSNNNSANFNGLTIKGNEFTNPMNNVVQFSNKCIEGEIIFSNNTIAGMKGRLTRISGLSSNAIVRFRNNKVVSPIQYDEVADPQVAKATGEAGFNVIDTGNNWTPGTFDDSKTTWIAYGDTSLIA